MRLGRSSWIKTFLFFFSRNYRGENTRKKFGGQLTSWYRGQSTQNFKKSILRLVSLGAKDTFPTTYRDVLSQDFFPRTPYCFFQGTVDGGTPTKSLGGSLGQYEDRELHSRSESEVQSSEPIAYFLPSDRRFVVRKWVEKKVIGNPKLDFCLFKGGEVLDFDLRRFPCLQPLIGTHSQL